MTARIAWVTNLDAPYRRPVWRALGAWCDLTVLLLDGDVQGDPGANRSADWTATAGDGYRVRSLRTLRVSRGEARYYLPRFRPGPVLRGADAVLLGGWESPAYWLLASRARLAGIRRVGFYESHRLSRRYRHGPVDRVRRAWFRSLDAVVVPGEAAASALRADGVDPARIVIGFNAVDVARFAAAPREEADHHRFLVVAQLIARKRVDAVVAALAEVPDAVLTIVGTGPERARLEADVAAAGLSGRVHFLGTVDQAALPTVYGRHDTLVLASDEEVWGLVVNEALAAGLQAVVVRTAGAAPSVVGMAGVSLVDPDGMGEGMAAAARAWTGPIPAPAILRRTPEAFAADFYRALVP